MTDCRVYGATKADRNRDFDSDIESVNREEKKTKLSVSSLLIKSLRSSKFLRGTKPNRLVLHIMQTYIWRIIQTFQCGYVVLHG